MLSISYFFLKLNFWGEEGFSLLALGGRGVIFYRNQPFQEENQSSSSFRKGKILPNFKSLISTLKALKECILDVGKDIILSVQTLQVK